MKGAWFTSENARFIGVLEHDLGSPEEDVWQFRIYPTAFQTGLQVAFEDEFPIENLISPCIDSLNSIYGWDEARNLILEHLEECENDN